MSGKDHDKTRMPLDIRVPTSEAPLDLEDDGPVTEEIPSHEARSLPRVIPVDSDATDEVEATTPEVLPDLEEDPPTQRMDQNQLPLPSRYRLLETGRIEGAVQTLEVLDTELDRMVVLCRWRGEPRRFRSWSRKRAQLELAGIPPVYDVGILPDGARYLTMQAVHGRGLGDAELDDTEYVRCWAEACRIVAWAHGRGMVHGDLVPRRVRIDDQERLQVCGWYGSAARPSVDMEALRRLLCARFPQAPDLLATSPSGLAEAGVAWFTRQTG